MSPIDTNTLQSTEIKTMNGKKLKLWNWQHSTGAHFKRSSLFFVCLFICCAVLFTFLNWVWVCSFWRGNEQKRGTWTTLCSIYSIPFLSIPLRKQNNAIVLWKIKWKHNKNELKTFEFSVAKWLRTTLRTGTVWSIATSSWLLHFFIWTHSYLYTNSW